MVHYVRGFTTPIVNSNIVQLYGELSVDENKVNKLISPLGGAIPTFPNDFGEIVSVSSTSELDTGKIEVWGLDSEYKIIKERVTLDGTNLVNTFNRFSRINNIVWLEKTAFVGEIRVTDTNNVNQYRSASPDSQTSRDCFFSVPASSKWFIDSIYASITRDSNAQSTGTVSVYGRPIGYAFRRYFKFGLANRGSSNSYYPNNVPYEDSNPSDIYLSAYVTDANINTPSEVIARLIIGLRAV